MKDLQRVARHAWAPFVARLVMDGRLGRAPHPALPVDDPRALTASAANAVREAVRRGVWAYLVREGGWRRTPFIDPARDRVAEGRLWQAPNLPPLAFSAVSIRLLIELFNATRSRPTTAQTTPVDRLALTAVELPLDPKRSGDLLLHHVVFRRLVETWPKGDDWQCSWHPGFAANPLNLMTHGHLFDLEDQDLEPCLNRLLDDDLRPYLPWLAHAWVGRWARVEPDRLATRDSLRVLSERQGRIWRVWMRSLTSAERYDGLVPFIVFWSGLDTFPALKEFEQLAAGCRLEERAELARPWVELLELAVELHATAEEVRALHPIEREAVHQLFLTACGEHDLDAAVARIEGLIQRLRPSLG